MGWSIGYDNTWDRDIGYGVPAWCDQPGCAKKIDRGLSYVCGREPRGGDKGCGLYFCGDHLYIGGPNDDPQMCQRCCDNEQPFDAKPDHPEWVAWKLCDESWAQWREEHPQIVAIMRAYCAASQEMARSEAVNHAD